MFPSLLACSSPEAWNPTNGHVQSSTAVKRLSMREKLRGDPRRSHRAIRKTLHVAVKTVDFLKVRFCGCPVGRKTDFSHLQRAKFYRPDLGRRCVRGCGSNYLQSETVLSFDVSFLETRSSDYPRSRNQNECARSQKLRVKEAKFRKYQRKSKEGGRSLT